MVTRIGVAVLFAAAALAVGLAVGVERGWVHPNHPSLDEFPVQGLDVSHHQGPIDWEAVGATGRFRFVWIKATEGGDWTDPRFDENWRGAREAGLIPGAYHYFTLCTPGAAQAAHFLATVPREPGGMLPLAADLEHAGNCTRGLPGPEGVRAEIRAFLDAIETETGTRPVVYTTREFHRTYLQGELDQHPVWIRGVLTRPGPVDGRPWAFWQYLSRGRVPGIDGFVDQNAFRGDEDRFAALVGG
jgi:lysozyme